MKLRYKIDTSKGRVLFCSDLHIDHSNILKINSKTRGHWSDIEEMNSWLKEKVWDSLKPGDTLFDLGDTFWKTDIDKIHNMLGGVDMGQIDLYKILGNHDAYGLYYPPEEPLRKYYFGLSGVSDLLDIQVRHEGVDYFLTLCHYPMVSWNHKPYGALMLHGHCHGNIDEFNESGTDLRVDIGMDGKLAQSLGTPMIDFVDILNYFKNKIGDLDFYGYVKRKGKNL